METVSEISAIDGLNRPCLDGGYGAAIVPSPGGKGEKKQKVLKVLHVVNGEYYSGAERVQDNLALGLAQFGYGVVFACVKDGRFAETRRAKNVPLYRISMPELGWRKSIDRLIRVCAQENIALLHAHTPRTAVLCAGVHRRTGLPWVYHAHSPTLWDSKRYLKNIVVGLVDWWAARQADRIIAVSESLRRYWVRLGIPARRVVTVPNGVAAWKSLTVRKPPEGSWVLGTMALFRPRKGVEILLKAIQGLSSRGYRLRVLAVGPFESEHYERHLKEMTHRLGLDEIVTWTGFVENTQEMLLAMDLFVLPSLFGEGCPWSCLRPWLQAFPSWRPQWREYPRLFAMVVKVCSFARVLLRPLRVQLHGFWTGLWIGRACAVRPTSASETDSHWKVWRRAWRRFMGSFPYLPGCQSENVSVALHQHQVGFRKRFDCG